MYVNGQYHAFAAFPSGRNPGTHRVGGCVTPTAGLKTSEKRKIPCPGSKPEPCGLYSVHYTEYAIPASPNPGEQTIHAAPSVPNLPRILEYRSSAFLPSRFFFTPP